MHENSIKKKHKHTQINTQLKEVGLNLTVDLNQKVHNNIIFTHLHKSNMNFAHPF